MAMGLPGSSHLGHFHRGVVFWSEWSWDFKDFSFDRWATYETHRSNAKISVSFDRWATYEAHRSNARTSMTSVYGFAGMGLRVFDYGEATTGFPGYSPEWELSAPPRYPRVLFFRPHYSEPRF